MSLHARSLLGVRPLRYLPVAPAHRLRLVLGESLGKLARRSELSATREPNGWDLFIFEEPAYGYDLRAVLRVVRRSHPEVLNQRKTGRTCAGDPNDIG